MTSRCITGEIRLYIDFRKLNAISIRDSFPLPRIEEALQAVQAAVWFSSFDLAQGYLQMAMEEEDIQKTTFRAGSSGLYEFTRMPFGLTNAGASFCRLMEICIGDQQYITLLFYLDNICVFAETADQMLDRIQFVFNRLKEFSLKIKPKKSHFFQAEVDFLGHLLSKNGVSLILKKLKGSVIGPLQQTPRKSTPSLDWLPIIADLFLILRNGQGLYTHSSFRRPHNTRSERDSFKKAIYRSLNGLKSVRQVSPT